MAVEQFSHPETKTDVRSFLGLVGYYRKFIRDFSNIAAPLSDLTKKGAPIKVTWTPDCERAFKLLKEALTSSPVLVNPDWGKPFVVQTDACERGIAAVLSQFDDDGQDHPVVYLSRKFLPLEMAYATIEKEFLAIVWALQELHPYLYGRRFSVHTDHQPLMWLQRIKNNNQRLLRWSLTLQEYDFDINIRQGN